MSYRSHRHFYRLAHRHHHPNGYLFECRRCRTENLYGYKFIRHAAFWNGAA